MNLTRSRIHWEDMGALDPCWAILSEPDKRDGRWQLDEFFATGEAEVSQLMHKVQQLGFFVPHGHALDFGCGVGRLTRALCRHFDRVTGIDISRSMVSRASSLHTDGKCTFVVNGSAMLPFQSEVFDFVLSAIVLQHVPEQKAIRSYVAEFARVLKPAGLMVIQLPSYIPWRRRLEARRRLYTWLRLIGISEAILYHRLRLHPIPMNYLPEGEVRAILERNQCRVLMSVPDNRAGAHIASRTYYASKD
jgi:2-polyprenyl-3-methyl-5-hydroxy-6-metoxy-1,4-benzoquinol methylase